LKSVVHSRLAILVVVLAAFYLGYVNWEQLEKVFDFINERMP